MTQEAADYKIWRPEYDGHAPPNWREGMEILEFRSIGTTEWRELAILPSWGKNYEYKVPSEALNSPNDDAVAKWKVADAADIASMVKSLRQYPADELAKHGITLAPEKDWATELWADLKRTEWSFAVDDPNGGRTITPSERDAADRAAIALIRERVVLKGEG